MPDPTARAMPDPTAFETAFEAAGHRLTRPRRVLAGLIEALGGQLEIIAHLPRGDIRIRQFKEAS